MLKCDRHSVQMSKPGDEILPIIIQIKTYDQSIDVTPGWPSG